MTSTEDVGKEGITDSDVFSLLREELHYCNENIQHTQEHVFKAISVFYIPIVALLAYALKVHLGNSVASCDFSQS